MLHFGRLGWDVRSFYRYSGSVPKVWEPIFGTSGSPSAWNWNGMMFHPAVTAPAAEGRLGASFEAYLVDAAPGEELLGAGSGPVVLTWTNVYFELGPDDDYQGKPRTWRRVASVPYPSRTVVFAENASGADHIMPNFWVTARDAVDVALRRHGGAANTTFVDGHAERRSFETLYDPERGVDGWNPDLAR